MQPKLYIYILGFLYLTLNPLYAQSQPSISTSAIPEIGKQVAYGGFEMAADPGPSGANVSWDFSELSIEEIDSAIIIVSTFQTPGDCIGHDSFPEATHCIAQTIDLLFDLGDLESLFDTLFDFYSYLKVTEDSIFDLGTANDLPFLGLTFNVLDNPDPILIFNLDFEESIADTNTTVQVDTILEAFIDTIKSIDIDYTTYDAYGTVKLPNYELSNAIRQTTISIEGETFSRRLVEDTTVFSFNSNSTHSETTAWYHESSIMPFVIIQKDISCDQSVFRGDTVINTCDTTLSYTYQLEFDGGNMSTSSHSVEDEYGTLSIYPTYTRGQINVDIPTEDKRSNHRLIVRNMNGQQIDYIQLSDGQNTLDLSLSPGLYLLTVQGYKTKKIVVF